MNDEVTKPIKTKKIHGTHAYYYALVNLIVSPTFLVDKCVTEPPHKKSNAELDMIFVIFEKKIFNLTPHTCL